MKKILVLLGVLFGGAAYSGQIVNVEYIHNAIADKWDITIPYNPSLANPRVAANMKYLLTSIDVANRMLGGASYYGDSEYATMVAADTIATDTAVETLVEKVEYKFFITTVDTDEFKFSIRASGTFYVDWGDGHVERITKASTANTQYSHVYPESGIWNIKLGGKATGYARNATYGTISFRGNTKLAEIKGSLGDIFSTISGSSQPQPRFFMTFSGCSNLSGEIPPNLFSGISGAPVSDMFYGTFSGCSQLTGTIPSNLFTDIAGAPAANIFRRTFTDCDKLSGEIPSDLFDGISGPPASNMFYSTFHGCGGLSGKIPSGLFAGISGAPASGMFYDTFYGCRNLSGGIPSGLFAGISGSPADDMFFGTFYGCGGLTGEIPSGLFAGISGFPASNMFNGTFMLCDKLTGAIPSGLFAGIHGAPASKMFHSTFYKCSNLTAIPDDLFGDINGEVQPEMFSRMFSGCRLLTGPSAKINGRYLYDIWSDATAEQVMGMYSNATGLTDFDAIPEVWKVDVVEVVE